MPAYTYLEEVADTSPCSANFMAAGQSAQSAYILSPASYLELQNSVIDILGYTGTKVTDGRIQRRLPVRHPVYQWMFADSLAHQGVGATYTTLTPDPGKTLPRPPGFTH